MATFPLGGTSNPKVTWDDRINLTLGYDGRAPSGAPTIHTARMQITASF